MRTRGSGSKRSSAVRLAGAPSKCAPALLAAAVTAALAMPSVAAGEGATTATLEPSLGPNAAGARTALTVRTRFSGAAGAIPAPLHRMVVMIPDGLAGNNLIWPTTRGCSKAHLMSHGARGCPASSRIGAGSSLLEWQEGARTTTAHASLSAFVGPTNGDYQLEILGEVTQPIKRRYVITEPEFAMSAPFSAGLEASIPAIKTRPGQPNASTVEFSLSVGPPSGHIARKGGPGLQFFVPRSCPAGGFPWAEELTYVGGQTEKLAATSPCP